MTVRVIYQNRGRYQSKMISLLQESWCKMKTMWNYVRLNSYQGKDSQTLRSTISWSISNFLSCLLPDRYIRPIYHNTCINNNISVVLFTFKPFFSNLPEKISSSVPDPFRFPMISLLFLCWLCKERQLLTRKCQFTQMDPKAMHAEVVLCTNTGSSPFRHQPVPKQVGA